MDTMSSSIRDGTVYLLLVTSTIWSTCSSQLFGHAGVYGQGIPERQSQSQLPPPPHPTPYQMTFPQPPAPMQPSNNQKLYPLHDNLPVQYIGVHPNDHNWMYPNGMPPPVDMRGKDRWIIDALFEDDDDDEDDGYYYNNLYYMTTSTTTTSTTTQPPTTTTTSYGAKYPKFYYDDDYSDVVVVAPANAIMISLINLVAVIMIFMGSEIIWVGRRSIDDLDDRLNSDTLGLAWINDGLALGSTVETRDQCLQRTACEVPRKAEIYAQAVDVVTVLKQIFTFIPDTADHLTKISQELREAASMADSGIDCKWHFPCKSIKYFAEDTDSDLQL